MTSATGSGAPPGPIERFCLSSHALTLLVAVGSLLRAWAYLARPPLWLDEILLARNIRELPLGRLLTGPLQLDQVAPRGFLLAEKIAITILGPGDLVLRLLPFLAGLAGLLLFRRLAERVLTGLAVPFALGLFAIGIPFLLYGVEVKQYELDATAAVILLLLTIDLLDHDRALSRLIGAGIAGAVLVWFSQAAVLVMSGIGLGTGLFWLSRRDGRTSRVLLVTVPIWGLAALAAVLVGRASMSPSTAAFMSEFWGTGFLPRPLGLGASARWLAEQMQSVFSDQTMLRYRWPPVYLLLSALGLAAIYRWRRPAVWLLLGPFCMGLVAAGLQQYPFRGRLMFYLVPGLLLCIAAGAEWIRVVLRRWAPWLGNAVMAGLMVPPVAALLLAPPPYDIEHIPELLTYLREHRQPGDSIYVFPLQRIGTRYYGPSFGLEPAQWTSGICERSDSRAYLRDVDRYRGVRRLWVISAGPRPFRKIRASMRSYLGTIGVRRDSLSRPSLTWESASLDLFDLSDSVRAAVTTAATFPVAPMPADPPPGCRRWAAPSPDDLPLGTGADQ